MTKAKKTVKKTTYGGGSGGINPANLLIGGVVGSFLQGFNGSSNTKKTVIKKK
jgi:hypothetical protein